MARALTRRAMFALPVALPVAVAAATLPAARRYASGGVLKGETVWLGENATESILPLRRITTLGIEFEVDDSQVSAAIGRLRAMNVAARFDDYDVARTLGIPHDGPPAFSDAEVAATLGIECGEPEAA